MRLFGGRAALFAGLRRSPAHGAITAVPGTIGTADAVLVYGGPRTAFDRHEPVLRRLGAGTTYLGVSTELPESAEAPADRAVAAGRGGDGYAALIEQFRTPAEVTRPRK